MTALNSYGRPPYNMQKNDTKWFCGACLEKSQQTTLVKNWIFILIALAAPISTNFPTSHYK